MKQFKPSLLASVIVPLIGFSSSAVLAKQPEFAKDSVIVVYKKSANSALRANARNIIKAKLKDVNADGRDDRFQHILDGRLAKLELKGMSVKDAIAQLKDHPAVEYVEPNYLVSVGATPDDPDFSALWGLHNTGQTGGTADADIDAPEAWDISVGSEDVVVGVIDTGVDHSHPDLMGNMWANPNEIPGDGIDNDNNGFIDDVYGINAITGSGDPMDDNGHGTHVAGTIGAQGNNTVGVVGVNHEVSMVGCKFLSASGSGSTADAITCIDYMVALKQSGVNVRILNNSWGGGGYSQALADAITSSEQADILFVAAAGNGAVDNDANPHYPSSYEHDSVLAIASTTDTDSMSGFSQWGLTSVDMGAPGSNILSTVPGNGYSSFSGTSMATPHVAGAAALALSVSPDLTFSELKSLLMSSGDPISALNGLTVAGTRLNAHQLLIDADPEPGFSFSLSPQQQSAVAGDTVTYSLDVNSVADWAGDVSLSLTSPIAEASLSATTTPAGSNVTLTVPTTAETAWGDYDFVITGQGNGQEKSVTASLSLSPQGLMDFSYSNPNPVAIPDNDPAGAQSVITVADQVTVFGTSVDVNISHTWIGDLNVTLTSPSGTVVTLHNNSGGSADDIVQTYTVSDFNGEVATGDWTLFVADSAGADTGTINSFGLTLSGLGEVTPQPPVAGFDVAKAGLDVSFTDLSSDPNDDIVSWSWDFGDGNTSVAQNPSHSYAAAGSYAVSLTVTDSEGLQSTTSQTIDVAEVNIDVTVTRSYLSRSGTLRVNLDYSGATSSDVEIYRNGVLIAVTSNTGRFRDFERGVSGTSFDYQVCEVGGACSDPVNVSF